MGADLLSSASVIDPFLAQIKAEGDKLSGITPTTSGGGYSPLLIVGAVLLVLLLVKRGA